MKLHLNLFFVLILCLIISNAHANIKEECTKIANEGIIKIDPTFESSKFNAIFNEKQCYYLVRYHPIIIKQSLLKGLILYLTKSTKYDGTRRYEVMIDKKKFTIIDILVLP